jgi:uncharacterized membrane protein
MDFKIKKTIKIISGILLIIAGWLSLGIGFTIKCPHPCNTAIFLGGFFLIIIGILVLVIKNKQHTTRGHSQ